MKKCLSASLMCADLTNISPALKALEDAGIEYLHIDIMDGAFVPNITLGFDFVNAVKKATSIPLDVHMMVNKPIRFLERMDLDENDIVSVHYEADDNIEETLKAIRKMGVKSALAINPTTPVEKVKDILKFADMLLVMTVTPGFAGQKMFKEAPEKVEEARKVLNESGLSHIPIEVDGNISPVNAGLLCPRGADIFVLGTSALFLKDKSLTDAARDFREVLV